MALKKQSDTILVNRLNVSDPQIAYVGIRVRAFLSGVEQQLYSNDAGTPTALVETNENGYYEFWIEEGEYELRFYAGGLLLGSQEYEILRTVKSVDLEAGTPVVAVETPIGPAPIQKTIGRKLGSEYVALEDFIVPDQGIDVTSELLTLIDDLKNNLTSNGKPSRVISERGGDFIISGDLPIDFENFWFEGSGLETRFIQTTGNRGLFRLLANGSTLRNFSFIYEGTRVTNSAVENRYYGFAAFQREGIMVHGGGHTIENVYIDNRSTGICLIGNPRYIGGAPAPSTATEAELDYSVQAVGNTIRNVTIRNADLGLTGHAQKDLFAEIIGYQTTKVQGIPPHLKYIEPKGIGAYRGFSTNCRLIGYSTDNPYSQAFKLEAITGLDCDFTARSCAGGVVMNLCSEGRVNLHTLTDATATDEGDPGYGMQITTSSDIAFTAGLVKGRANERVVGAMFRRGCVRSSLSGMILVQSQPEATQNSPYRVQSEDGSIDNVSFINCGNHRVNPDGTPATPIPTGDNRNPAMFVASGPLATVNIVNPVQSGSRNLFDGTGSVRGVYNSSLLDASGLPIIDTINLTHRVTDSRKEGYVITTDPATGTGIGIFNGGSPGTEAASYTSKYVWEFRDDRRVFQRVRIVLPITHGLTGASPIQFRWTRYLVDTGASRVSSPQLATVANITSPANTQVVIVPNANTRSATLCSMVNGIATPINVSQLSTTLPPSIEFEMEFDTDDNWL